MALLLEDFCESIETLPQDMKNSFSTMRTLDLRVQNRLDQMEKKIKHLFSHATRMRPEARKKELNEVKKGQKTALDDSDEKLQIASQTVDLINRVIKKLDMDIKAFGEELENASPGIGITKTLESRSLALDVAKTTEESPEPPVGPTEEELNYEAEAEELLENAVQNLKRNVQKRQQKTEMTVLDPIQEANALADPDEPRYCICNQVSYGEMVGCDNDNCQIEWFHYACVGVTEPPKGKWYCPQCRAISRKRPRQA